MLVKEINIRPNLWFLNYHMISVLLFDRKITSFLS